MIRRTVAAVAVTMVALLVAAAMVPTATAYQAKMHQELGEKALGVLAADNKTYASGYMKALDPSGKSLREWFLEGLYDCDRLDLARNHYYNPLIGKGLTEYSSLELCQDLYDQAVKFWKSGEYGRSIYYLGRAAHMVMDSTVPHHGHNDALNGHAEFEAWLAANVDRFDVTSGGLYNYSVNASLFVDLNARQVYDLYADIKSSNASDSSYAQVAAVIEPLAIRSAAGFLALFARDVSGTAPEFYIQELADNKARLTWQPATDRDFVRYEVYVSEPGKHVDLTKTDLLKEVTGRGDNTLTITKLAKYGVYQVQVVTVLANDTLASDILTIKVGTGKAVVIVVIIGVITVMALGLTLSMKKGNRRRKT